MKIKYCIFSVFMLLLLMNCGGDSEPKEYIHTQAGFSIRAPAGWKKTLEDHEMYEFRSGNLKLIEVGGFDLDIPAEDLHSISDDDFWYMLKESTLDGLDGYCIEATIKGYKIEEQGETEWGGGYAYRVRASGYSSDALSQMVVDIIATIYEKENRMYMFASQVAKSDYEKTKPDLESMIKSFKLLQ